MKLAAIYNVWDGDEILPYSIAQIRPHVDVIIIVYQTLSNFGEKYTPTIPNNVASFEYIPDISRGGIWNERRKRNIGLELARAEECTHFIMMDCDEIYDGDTFKQWRDKAIQFDSSACRMITYYKHPDIRLSPIEDYYVPFISRIYPDTTLGVMGYPVRVDPTRSVSSHKNMLVIDEPIMHHFSWVRADIGRKLRNSSASVNWKSRIDDMVEAFNKFDETGKMVQFEQYNWVKVANRFNLPRFG